MTGSWGRISPAPQGLPATQHPPPSGMPRTALSPSQYRVRHRTALPPRFTRIGDREVVQPEAQEARRSCAPSPTGGGGIAFLNLSQFSAISQFPANFRKFPQFFAKFSQFFLSETHKHSAPPVRKWCSLGLRARRRRDATRRTSSRSLRRLTMCQTEGRRAGDAVPKRQWQHQT